MIISLNMTDPVPANNHNHTPDYAAISSTKCINNMRREAAETEDKPSQIYSNNLNGLPAEAKALFSSEDIIKRALLNQRTKLYPQVPERLEDLQLTGEWTTTAAPEHKPLLLFDNGPDTANRIIAFGSDESLRLLASADIWLMDGNYAMSSQGFLQLYVISAPIGNTAVSTLSACLQNKTQDTYETLLQAVMDRCHEIDLYPDPTTIIVDFEQATTQAVNNVFWTRNTHTKLFLPLDSEYLEKNTRSWPYQPLQREWGLSSILWTDRLIGISTSKRCSSGNAITQGKMS